MKKSADSENYFERTYKLEFFSKSEILFFVNYGPIMFTTNTFMITRALIKYTIYRQFTGISSYF